MYARDYKNSAPGQYYHIYNRGNAREKIFRDPDDYRLFLLRLRQNIKPDGTESRFFRPLPLGAFSLVAYCLMPNHFHLLIRQNKDISTSILMGKVCTSYSKCFNKKYDRVGHIFQDQFKQKIIEDNEYLMWLSAYIHLNPVEAGIVQDAFQYLWSSAGAFCASENNEFIEADIIKEQICGSYRSFLVEARLAQEYRELEQDVKGAL